MQEDKFDYRAYFPVSKILKPELRKGGQMSVLWSEKCKEESVRLARLPTLTSQQSFILTSQND